MRTYQKPFFGHTPTDLWHKLKPLAREKRHDPTIAEQRLWHFIRNQQLCGVKFRRQYSIERFIVDFYTSEVELVIEVDGPIHDYTVEEDAIRQEFIESLGLTVIRFTNDDVLNNIPRVLQQMQAAIEGKRPDATPPLHDGEGDGG